MKRFYIKKYSHIRKNKIWKNRELIFSDENSEFQDFSKRAYHALKPDYSRFFKMDNLSKLAFLASEILLSGETSGPENDIALVFSNRASSLDTDRKHWETIKDKEDYFPRPAVFVYTLPNICLGEISIRHKLFSENSFYIFDRFNPEYLRLYADSLLNGKKADQVLCGWVDFDSNSYEAFLYLVSKEGEIIHNEKEITKLYNLNYD